MKPDQKTEVFHKNITESDLKAISAYANNHDNQIIFRIDNQENAGNGENSESICLNIENAIHEHIVPVPDYNLRITKENTIILNIYESDDPPYLYDGTAYKQFKSSFVPVSALEFKRLSLKGQKKNY